jgi:alpha-L-rhamnosidase
MLWRQCCLSLVLASAMSAAAGSDLIRSNWKARWIRVPGAPASEYGVYHFRRAFTLDAKPASFVVHVSGDNRYQLYANGVRVAWGPARGDLKHWRFETVDLAPHLAAGRNVLAAIVWNDGPYAAVAQISSQTGFLLQGAGQLEQVVNTDAQWRCARNTAYAANPLAPEHATGYYAAPPGERIDAALYPWGWEKPDFDDQSWAPAEAGKTAAGRYAQDSPAPWMLVPRSIPFMEETPERLSRVRRSAGVTPPAEFPRRAAPFKIPARARAKILLDQNHLTTAFPELTVSGGKGATVSLRYAEAMWKPGKPREKAHRDTVDGLVVLGNQDVFTADGGRRQFRTLHWRTFRYIEMEIETRDAPLTIEDLRGVYTGYPFQRRARFESDSAELAKILDIGWRTARLCAHESYMDCPYYEQLQYAGDTRIQAMVSVYMTGDTRLMRNAIEQLDSSRTSEGATFSRAPSALQQYIPPFSLWWIGMLHDYWMYADDPAFVRQMLPGVRSVLAFFARYQKANGSLGRLPWWNFVDWVPAWKSGVPPAGEEGSSAPLDLQLLLAYQWAAAMERAHGLPALATVYQDEAERLSHAIVDLYWDPARGLFADTPDKRDFSQHTNALAVLAHVKTGDDARRIIRSSLADKSLSQATIYFRYYLHLAMREAGLGDRYVDMLDTWREMIAQGSTTWAEWSGPRVRSECHAWGSSPNIELLRTVLGVDSASPGWKKVVVRPHLGKLTRVSGTVPHPAGEITVRLEMRDGKPAGEITLPPGISGEFVWRGIRLPLSPGRNTL